MPCATCDEPASVTLTIRSRDGDHEAPYCAACLPAAIVHLVTTTPGFVAFAWDDDRRHVTVWTCPQTKEG
jgi:hypothetical protein